MYQKIAHLLSKKPHFLTKALTALRPRPLSRLPLTFSYSPKCGLSDDTLKSSLGIKAASVEAI